MIFRSLTNAYQFDSTYLADLTSQFYVPIRLPNQGLVCTISFMTDASIFSTKPLKKATV